MKEDTKRATIYLDARIHRALKLKSLETDKPMSELVNAALWHSLAEDAEDLMLFEERAKEPELDFEQVVKGWKRDGLL